MSYVNTYAGLLSMATDNNVYQLLPQTVVLPWSTEDVSLLGRISVKPEYKNVTFSARGGGMGTNGQSLTSGIIVDFSVT